MGKDGLYLIVRGDDAGGNPSVNEAIKESAENGLLRNISLMANGAAIEHAAEVLSGLRNVNFGVHLTLNSEWDNVRWGPVSPADQVPSLLDEEGYLYRTPRLFRNFDVDIDEVFIEMDNQLERLRTLGFHITYADEHMWFGDVFPDFEERFAKWCERSGLVNWRRFNRQLPALGEKEQQLSLVEQTIQKLDQVEAGLYTLVTHPAFDSPEMKQMGNEHISGDRISAERNQDRLLLIDTAFRAYCEKRGITCINYQEADLL